jgi:Rrf2 family protein
MSAVSLMPTTSGQPPRAPYAFSTPISNESQPEVRTQISSKSAADQPASGPASPNHLHYIYLLTWYLLPWYLESVGSLVSRSTAPERLEAPFEHRYYDGHGIAWPPAKTIYALRACIALATLGPGERMKTGEIAQAAAAPKGFLSKILGELRAADIVSAQRGYRGGYRLTRPPDDIRVDELLNAVGTRDPFASLSCGVDAPLPLIDELRSRLHALAAEVLHGASLAELSANAAQNMT